MRLLTTFSITPPPPLRLRLDEMGPRALSMKGHVFLPFVLTPNPPLPLPKSVASILKDFWQNLGNVRKDAPPSSCIDEYLSDYDIIIPPSLSPHIPGLDDIIDCINGTNNSCPGPDGVHLLLFGLLPPS